MKFRPKCRTKFSYYVGKLCNIEGRVLSKRAWGKTLYENHYDACGRLRELITGEQKTSYGYDKAGRLAEVCASNGIRAQYRYDKNDMQTEVLYGNGLRTSYTYDERSQLTGMETVRRDGTVLHKAAYGYDNAGNRIFREEQHTSRMAQIQHDKTGYTYDSMNRLTEEKRNDAVTAYRYDPAGNRTAKSTAGRIEQYIYNNRNQLTELHCLETSAGIAGTSVIRYTYDNAGNLTEENHLTADGISKKKRLYAYDAYNRNTEITGDDFTQQNHYDAEGYRDSVTEKDLHTGNTKTTGFAYQQGMLLAELDENKEAIRHYIPGNAYIGVDNSYYLTDEQGSVRYVLSADADANVQNIYQYDAFGENVARDERIPNHLKYNAQIEDELTGLYYLRARYYNASLGRFTQEDVIYNDGLNLYAYCGSNPVMYCDPSGFAKEGCEPKIGGEKGSDSNGIYEKADYHGNKNNAIKNKAPNKGQEALDNSVAISPNTTRRVGISDGEIVVFDETTSGIFHGHVRSWNELSEAMKVALRKSGKVNKKGKIIQ